MYLNNLTVDGRIQVIPTTNKVFTSAKNYDLTVSSDYNKVYENITIKTESVVTSNTTSKKIIADISSTESFLTAKESVTQKKISNTESLITEKESVTQKNISIDDIFITSQKTKEAFDIQKFLSGC